MTNFPAGVASFGLPVLPSSVPSTSGAVYFVDSVTGSNGNSGADTKHPFATVAYAITRCSAAKGDTIVCLPGHAEALASAGAIAVSKSGLRIVGLGTGRDRPLFTFTTAIGASFNVTAANVLVQNVVFKAAFDALTAMINVSAADVTFRGCEVEFTDASYQSVLALLTTAAADRLTVDSCHFHGSADAGTAAAIRLVGGDSVRFVNNTIVGSFTTTLGGIDNVTTPATNALVVGNIISNVTASAAKAMVWVSTSTLVFANNRLAVLTGTAPVTAAAGTNGGGNYYSAAAGVSAGTLL